MKYQDKKLIEVRPEYFTHIKGPKVAIELEIETTKPLQSMNYVDPYFTIHRDGSLGSSGLELVSREPFDLTKEWPDISKNLALFFKENTFADSDRTSTHVHINVHDLTYLQIYMYCVLFWYFEEMFFQVVKESRKNNMYCLSLNDSTTFLEDFISISEGKKILDRTIRNNQRYANLNLASLSKFGSLEARWLDGEPDLERLEKVLETLVALYHKVLEFNHPGQLLHFLSHISEKDLLNDILGKTLSSWWTKKVPDYLEHITKNFTFIDMLCTADPEWRYEPKNTSKKSTPKNITRLKTKLKKNQQERKERELDAFLNKPTLERAIRARVSPSPRQDNLFNSIHTEREGIPYTIATYMSLYQSSYMQERLYLLDPQHPVHQSSTTEPSRFFSEVRLNGFFELWPVFYCPVHLLPLAVRDYIQENLSTRIFTFKSINYFVVHELPESTRQIRNMLIADSNNNLEFNIPD